MGTLLLLLLACGGDDKDSTGGGDSDPNTGVEPVCTEPTEPSCVDALISDMSMHDDKISEGEVTNTTDGEDFVTNVDASAGGFYEYADNAWVYIKFTPEGAVRVDITDEDSLESMDWDMSLRRYILRLNGGDSGPSCVGAAAFLEMSYSDLTAVPDGMSYATDDFYTDDCSFINDSSGLEGSPQVVMSPWWSYPGCVATSDVPFLIQLADGSIIKLVVESYYDEGQSNCNATGQATGNGGYIQMRWRFM